MDNRRLEGRFLCADLVQLDWLTDNGLRAIAPGNPGPGEAGEQRNEGQWREAAGSDYGVVRSEQALLEDISPLGGCVQLEEPVPVGSIVMLTVGATPFYGHVCYCTFRDDTYFIGLRFSNDTPWSTRVVVPQHLVSLRQLGLAAEAHEQEFAALSRDSGE